MVAYWWVEETSNTKLVNMTDDVIEKNGVSIPILKNSVVLEPHVKLYKYKAAARKKDNAVIMDELSGSKASSSASKAASSGSKPKPPAKRAKHA